MPSALATPSRLASRGVSVAGLIAVALALPVFATRVWVTAYADHLATVVALRVGALVPSLGASESEADLGEPSEPELAATPSTLAASFDGNGATKARVRGRSAGAQHGIRISASQILALAARRAMPQAVPVKANAQHPAGLSLRGVGALGIGLQDGDVLTEAAGQKATSVATVVGIVLAARGRQVPEISGRFYRGWVPFSLTVEQPYPKEPVPG